MILAVGAAHTVFCIFCYLKQIPHLQILIRRTEKGWQEVDVHTHIDMHIYTQHEYDKLCNSDMNIEKISNCYHDRIKKIYR